MREYKKLEVWTMAVELSTEVYKVTLNFPKFEQFGITSQIQRSAVSVPSNIAEGAGRGSEKQFSQFLHIAYGSLCELETQLLIAQNLKYTNEEQSGGLFEKIIHLQKKIFNLNKTLNNN
jgi:four helix bundle protein